MAGLPRQFPDLAIHLTDQARTPIITSSATDEDDPPVQQQEPSLAIADDSVSPKSHAGGGSPQILPKPTRQQRAQALDDLAATALRARDAAARLGLGADLPSVGQDLDGPEASTAALMAALGMTPPEHLVVTYNTGAVVIESFLDDRSGNGNGNSTNTQNKDSDRVNGLDNGDSQTPLLVGVVAAPDAQSLGDARRATARLERVGRQVQQELVAQQRR